MQDNKPGGSAMEKVAAFIVDKRNLFFLLYIFALVFSVIASGWVSVENDITVYLAEDTETRRGLTVMNGEFITYGSARVMVSNVTYAEAESIRDRMEAIPGVDTVTFDGSADHYKDSAALYNIAFDGTASDPVSVGALDAIRAELAAYDLYADTTVGVDETESLKAEMGIILVVAAIIIVVMLTLTSRSYAEVPVLILTFGAAALLNMGTNFLCGTISFISDSVTVVLQLALAIDYAIILCHRFSDEHQTRPAREACVAALSKAIPEIASSSLTTISGLAAMGFMHFGIGLDMAVVLIKAILFSLLSVFTLMPGLLMLFSPLIDRTQHKNLVPNITFLGRFAVRTRYIIPPIFAVVLAAAYFLSSACPYCFSYNDLITDKQSENQIAHHKITEAFGPENMVAVLVPAGDYRAEAEVLRTLDAMPEVKSTMGLSNIEAMDGHKLADALTPRQFSELAGLDYEVAQALYSAYAVEQDQYGKILNGLENYEIPLFDLFLFLKDQMQTNNITLAGGDQQTIDELFAQLDKAKAQLRSDEYSRLVVYLTLPEESGETFAFLDTIHAVLDRCYPGQTCYVVGNSTSARDLSATFADDNTLISILSALFVILILLFTFQSAGLPVLLIVVIQGSIWINFSFPTIFDEPLYFLGYLVVNAIQMGANIDYAIVISSHYKELKETLPPREAIVQALNAAFPTILTSGSILAAAGILISKLTTQPVIVAVGECIGRGTIISIVLVLCVLPQILVLGDTVIERTRFEVKPVGIPIRSASGTVSVSGHIRGYVSGVVDADFDGILHGQINAAVSTGTAVEAQPVLPQTTKGEDDDEA